MPNFIVFFRNPRVPCHSLPDLDVSHWREEVTQCRVNGININLGSSKKISPCTSCTCTKEGVREIEQKNLGDFNATFFFFFSRPSASP